MRLDAHTHRSMPPASARLATRLSGNRGRRARREIRMSIVTILIIVVLVLLALYLFQRVR
jgi:type VI protein secretion system component VasF